MSVRCHANPQAARGLGLGGAALCLGLALVILLGAPAAVHAQGDEAFPTTLVYPAFRHTWGIFRVTESLVQLFLGERGRIDDPQGVAAVRLRETDDPATEADDDEVTVIGVNAGTGDLLYNPSMSGVAAFGGTEDPRAGFLRPRGVAADEEGNIFVADSGHGRIVRLRLRKGAMTWVGELGSGNLSRPVGLALDRRGRVFIADPGRNRILVVAYDGAPLGDPVTVPTPTAIAVSDSTDRWSSFREEAVYVACRDCTEVWRIGPGGQAVARVSAPDLPGSPPARFGWLALDYCDNVYATDPARNAVHKFDRNLNYLTTFGGPGRGDAQFLSPRGIAIHRRFGQTFVVEAAGAQYYWVGADLRALDARFAPEGEEVIITLFPTERAFLKILVLRGRSPIRNLFSRRVAEPGLNRFAWDLKDETGRKVRPGTYAIRVEVQPTYSSYTHFRKDFERVVEVR